MKTQGNVVLSLLVIWLLRIIDFTLASSCDAHDFRLISYNGKWNMKIPLKTSLEKYVVPTILHKESRL